MLFNQENSSNVLFSINNDTISAIIYNNYLPYITYILLIIGTVIIIKNLNKYKIQDNTIKNND